MQKMIAGEAASRPAFHTLETFVRAQVRGFIQHLKDEVAEFAGAAEVGATRAKRRAAGLSQRTR